MEQKDADLRLAILQKLALRGEGRGARMHLEFEAYSEPEVQNMIERLHRGGYIEAAHVRAHFSAGPPRMRWEPSILTAKGRQLLEELLR